jgi:hypothetical protein
VNLTQLRKESKKWQKKLGLHAWKIKVVWAKPSDLGEKEDEICYGLNLFDPNHMESTILILSPKHGDHDPMVVLIHELLHLFMFPLESAAGFSIKTPSDQWETALEQTINKLSELLKEGNNGRECNASDRSPAGNDSNSQG